MHRLRRADTQQDAQDLPMSDPLRQRRVETGATLFDRAKMKARCVGDRLDVVRRRQVGIGPGNGRKLLPHKQAGDGLREGVAEIRVLGPAAVAGPPTGVHFELHQVGEAADLLRAGCLAARQRAEPIQIGWLHAMRNQICVDEVEVGELILGIVVDILRHIRVQHRERGRVNCTPTPAGDFAVLNATEFIVLLP